MDDIRKKITKRVREAILSHNMIQRGDTVIAALSGGADSVCLLHVLGSLKSEMDFELAAVHVNHGLRGEESDRDSLFCERLCQSRNIPITVCFVDVAGYVRKTGKSTEEAARILRYNALNGAFTDWGSRVIATAHNMDDNAETVLFNMTRGSGTRGIRGIPYVRDNIIRPLLGVARAEIEEYLRAEGADYVTDSTNLTDDYSRNRIRHRVVPELEAVNSGFSVNVSRLSRSAAEDEDYFDRLLDSLDPSELSGYHSAVRKRYIRRLLQEKGAECSYDRLCAIDRLVKSGKSGRICLHGSLFAVTRNGSLAVEEIKRSVSQVISRSVKFGADELISIDEFDKTVIISGDYCDFFNDNNIINENLTYDAVNCGKIQGDVVLRNKRDGDKIVLAGRDFSTKLKKLYNSLKLPEECRRTALVMEDSLGLIWSEYGGTAQRVRVTENDDKKDIYKITVRRSENDGK
ncbi:MAG: tRNA lysidine(34) synthetase TilS [Ruminococcus sp.]|nr:tRNA lysidine(34) synthetase TilS [Ruminococcus sp.]